MPAFLDTTARKFQTEAGAQYSRMKLEERLALDQGHEVLLLKWMGDVANEALACLHLRRGFMAMPSSPGVKVRKNDGGLQDVIDVLADTAQDDAPSIATSS